MAEMVRQQQQSQPVHTAQDEAELPPEVQEYINAARAKSAELHGDFQGDETPAEMMARMNAHLEKTPSKPRRKRPMVRQRVETDVHAEAKPEPIPVQDPVQEQPAQSMPEVPKYLSTGPEQSQPVHVATPIPEHTAAREPVLEQATPTQPAPAQHVMVHQDDTPATLDLSAPRRDYDAFSLITALPSQGIVYKNSIYGQSLSLVDILLLEGATEYDTVDIFDEILSRRVRGVDPGDILWCDEAYIFQWLRISSFPNIGIPYTRGYVCPECGYNENSPDYQISFKNMDFRMNTDPAKVVESMPEGYFPFNFSDGRECDVYLRRRRHDRVIQKWLNDYVKKNGQSPKRAYINLSAIAAILEIEGCQTHEDKLNYIANIKNRDDYMLMTEVVNSHSLVAENHVVHTCPRCGAKADTIYPFRTDEYVSNL